MPGINRWTRRKVIIKDRLVFGGGHPKMRLTPRIVKWGANVSIFWLGTELIWIGGENSLLESK
jgi:hypothetical protein